MRTQRQAYLDKLILRACAACGNFPLPETALRDQLDVRLAPPLGKGELEGSLKYLKAEGRLTAIEGETCLAWVLTPTGKGWLAANQQGVSGI